MDEISVATYQPFVSNLQSFEPGHKTFLTAQKLAIKKKDFIRQRYFHFCRLNPDLKNNRLHMATLFMLVNDREQFKNTGQWTNIVHWNPIFKYSGKQCEYPFLLLSSSFKLGGSSIDKILEPCPNRLPTSASTCSALPNTHTHISQTHQLHENNINSVSNSAIDLGSPPSDMCKNGIDISCRKSSSLPHTLSFNSREEGGGFSNQKSSGAILDIASRPLTHGTPLIHHGFGLKTTADGW